MTRAQTTTTTTTEFEYTELSLFVTVKRDSQRSNAQRVRSSCHKFVKRTRADVEISTSTAKLKATSKNSVSFLR